MNIDRPGNAGQIERTVRTERHERSGQGNPTLLARGIRNENQGFDLRYSAAGKTRQRATGEDVLGRLSTRQWANHGNTPVYSSSPGDSGGFETDADSDLESDVRSSTGSDRPEDTGSDIESSADEPARVRIDRHLLTRKIKVSNEDAVSRLAGLKRMLKLVLGRDGYDDLANLLPKLFSEKDRAFIELGLMGPFTLIVIWAAINAIREALGTYREDYPEAVQDALAQQKQMIDALRESGSSEEDLSLLIKLYNKGCHVAAERSQMRAAGLPHLVSRNLRARWNHTEGNGKLSKQFNAQARTQLENDTQLASEDPTTLAAVFCDETRDLIEHHAAKKRILQASENNVYQFTLLEKLEQNRRLVKKDRTSKFFQGGAMTGMAAGMVLATGGAGGNVGYTVAKNANNLASMAAAEATSGALDGVANGLFLGSQIASGISAVRATVNAGIERKDIKRTADAVHQIGDSLPPSVEQLHQQNTQFDLRANTRKQATKIGIGVSQGAMATSTVISMTAAPAVVAIPFVVGGVVGTILCTLGYEANEKHTAKHNGEHALQELKDQLTVGNLGEDIKAQGLHATTWNTAVDYRGAQDDMVQTALWHSITQAMRKENPLKHGRAKCDKRHAQVVKDTHSRHIRSELLRDGAKAMQKLQQDKYPRTFFAQSAIDIYQALILEMSTHPNQPEVIASRKFRQDVLYETVCELATQDDPQIQALFRDEHGELVAHITQDDGFRALLNSNVAARNIYLQKFCEILARELYPGSSFSRHQNHEALGDLANARKNWREIMKDDTVSTRL